MVEYLSSVSLADLMKQQEGRVVMQDMRTPKMKTEMPHKVSKPAVDPVKKEPEAKKPLANSVFTFAQQIN
jgi:Rrf2 family iron-sulfur cluster assembly transcriptional regulator